MANLLVVILNDPSLLPDLFDAWKRIGVPGVTLLHSVGGYRVKTWLDKMGLGGLGRFFEREEIQQRMLLSLIDDDEELLEKAIAEADEVVGGFDRPDSGMLFVLPVTRALGLKKWRKPPEKEEEEPAEGEKPVRTLKISEVLDLLGLEPAEISPDATLEDAVNAALAHRAAQVLAVVNNEGRLVGVLDRSTLAEALLLTVFPEEFIGSVQDLDQALDFADRMRIRAVSDVMGEPAWVGLDDTVKDAFHTMYQRKLPGIPVVDEHYKVVGYVNMLDLMAIQINEMRKSRRESDDD